MTLSTLNAKSGPYTCNGVVVNFNITFTYDDEDEILVLRETISTGVETTMTVGLLNDYTLTGGDPVNGVLPTTVTFNSAPSALYRITILRVSDKTQTLDYTAGGPLQLTSLEAQLDRIVQMVQEMEEELGRTPKLKRTTTQSTPVLPDPTADYLIGWNSGGTDLENKPAGNGSGAAPADQDFVSMTADATIPNARVLSVGAGLTLTDAGAGSTVTLAPDFGTSAGKTAQGNDSRFTDSRAPNGAAGGDLTGTYPNPTVDVNKITNAQLAQIATARFKGRTSALTGNVEDLTAAQATALLSAMVGDSGAGGTKGLVPAPATGDSAKFLRGDATWAAASGGGGGGGIRWDAISGTAPVPTEENGTICYLFGAGLAQELYTVIKVPQSYVAGTQIFMYVSAYSPSAASTILLLAQATLIRTGTDALTSTTNQRTTTNAALTNTLANMGREFVLDLTDSTGKINSVACAAGHLIKVRLYRDTDTDTADIRMISNATDLKTTA